jgi:hypothetical protein
LSKPNQPAISLNDAPVPTTNLEVDPKP